MLMLDSRKPIDDKVFNLPPVDGEGIDPLRVLPGQAYKNGIRVGELVIDPTLIELFIGGLGIRDRFSCDAIPQVGGSGSRQGVMVKPTENRGVQTCYRNAVDDTRPCLQGGNTDLVGSGQPLFKTLEVEEEEGLVWNDGASDAEPKLIAFELSLLLAHESAGGIGNDGSPKRGGVQIVVAVKPIDRAMKIIGARLGDHVDDASRGTSILGTVGVLFDLELLDGFAADKIARDT